MSAKPTTSTSKIVNMSNFNTNSSNSSSNAVNSGNGSTKMASRRIFPPEFKLKVLESYHTDAECKGNQRATARKYGIHRRQIQKWLQSENILRLSITNSYRNVKQFHNVTIAAAAAPSSTNNSTAAGPGGNQSQQNAKHHDNICSGGISPNDSNNNDSNNNINNNNNNSSGSSFGSVAMVGTAGVGVVQASSILNRRKQFSIPKRDQPYHGHQHQHQHHHHHHHHAQAHIQSQSQHPQQSSFKINLVPSPDKGRQNVSFIPLSGKFRTPSQCAGGASVVPDEKVKDGGAATIACAGKNVATIKQEVSATSLSSSSLSLALEPVVSNVATLSSHHHHHHQHRHFQHHQQQQQQQQQQQIKQRQSSEDLSATQVVAAAVPVHQQAKQQSPIHPSVVLSIEQQNLEMRHKSSGSGDTDSGAINTSTASPHPIQQRSPDRLFSTTIITTTTTSTPPTTTTPYSSFTSLHNYNSPQYQPFFHQFRQDESYQQQAHHLTTHLHPHEIPYKIILGSPSTLSSSACLPCTAADHSSPATSELRDYQPISGVSSAAKTNYALVVGKGSMPSTNYYDVKREQDISLYGGDNGNYFPATPIDLSLSRPHQTSSSSSPSQREHERFYDGGMLQLEPTSNSCSQCTPAADNFIHNQLPPPSSLSSSSAVAVAAASTTSFTCCQSSENYATTSHASTDDALNLTQYERRKRHASNHHHDNDNDDDDDNNTQTGVTRGGNAKIAKLSPNNDTAMKVKQEPKEQPQKPVKLFKPYALDNEEKDADSIKKTDTINNIVPENNNNNSNNKINQQKQEINEMKTTLITSSSSISNDKDPIIWNNHPFSMIPPPLHNNRDCYSALVPRQHTSTHELSSTAVSSSSFHGTTNNSFPIIEPRPALFQCSLPHIGSTNGSLASSNTSLSSPNSSSSSSSASSSSSTPPATTSGCNNICWGPKCSPAATSGYDSTASSSGYSDSNDPIFHGSITPPIIIPHCSRTSLLPSPGQVRLVPENQPVYSVDFKLEPLYYYYDSASISPTSSTSSAAASPTFGIQHYKETHWNAMMTNKLSLMAK